MCAANVHVVRTRMLMRHHPHLPCPPSSVARTYLRVRVGPVRSRCGADTELSAVRVAVCVVYTIPSHCRAWQFMETNAKRFDTVGLNRPSWVKIPPNLDWVPPTRFPSAMETQPPGGSQVGFHTVPQSNGLYMLSRLRFISAYFGDHRLLPG